MQAALTTTKEETLPLTRAVLFTLAYFEVLQHPVTAVDVWRWLYRCTASLQEVRTALVGLERRGHVHREGGWYALQNGPRGEQGNARYLDAERKHRMARRYARYVMCVPGVRGVAVCNSLALNDVRPTSDIDCFVIVRAGSLWLARLLATAPLILLRRRPGQSHTDPIDLSFFLSDQALNLADVRPVDEDVHGAHWLFSMLPLCGRERFQALEAANTWVRDYFPQATMTQAAAYRRLSERWRWVGEGADRLLRLLRLHGPLNRLAQRVQERRFPEPIRAQMNQTPHVIVNEDMLKFHTNDRRLERYNAWKQRITTLPSAS